MAYSNGIAKTRVGEVLEQAGLASVANKKAGGFSLGMQQRLGIAAALLGDPPILMFDEPMNGLDPEGFQWIRGLLRGLAAEGRAVLVSSHLMNELEGSADHLVVIGRGRVLADRSVREVLAEASGERVAVRTSQQMEAMTALSNGGGTVTATDDEVVTVSGLPAQRVIEILSAGNIAMSEVSAHRATLEEAYLELTRNAAEFAATPADGGRDA
jgi:ABC-2 type transport system ATP-binding protein